MEAMPFLESRPRELGIMYSRRCNISCRHCGIESSPEVTDCMGMVAARRIIVEAAAIPGFAKMTFTGGEPLLYPRQHLELVRLCTDLGLDSRIVTNGFWARNAAHGRRLLNRLRDVGLGELNFSADRFHLEFMPADVTTRALELAREASFVRIVSFVTNDVSKPPLDQFAELYGVDRSTLRDLRDEAGAAGQPRLELDPIYIYSGGLIGLGRAAREAHELHVFAESYFPDALACGEVVNKPVVYPDGSFQACCCAGGKIKAFTIGNAFEHSIATLYAMMESRSGFSFINSHGPKALYRLLKAERAVPARVGFPSVCDMCVHTFESADAPTLDRLAGDEIVRRTLDILTAPRPVASCTH